MPSVFVMRRQRAAFVRVTGSAVQALVAQGHAVDVTGVSTQVLIAAPATTARVTGAAVQVLITGGG